MFIANEHVFHHTTPTESNMDANVTIPINIQSLSGLTFQKHTICDNCFLFLKREIITEKNTLFQKK